MMHTCPRCTNDFPRTSEFFGRGQCADGMHSWCLSCRRQYVRSRSDRATARTRSAAWAKTHPERSRQRNREWCRANPDRKRTSDRRWYENNRDRVAANSRRWQEQNRERYLLAKRVTQARRRARIADAPGNATVDQVISRILYFGSKCWMCGGPWSALDHVIPISRGGTNWASNLRPACRSCNSRKGARSHKEVVPSL